MSLFNINMKPYAGSPVALSHLTLNDIEGQVKVTKILKPYISQRSRVESCYY